MAILVSSIIDDAALLTGDPNKERTLPSQWLAIYNMAVRRMCKKFRLLKREWKSDLSAHVITYPDDMTVLTQVRVALVPNEITDFTTLREIPTEDEFRAMTQGQYPQQERPSEYFADPEVAYLVGRPITSVADGLRFHGFGLPDTVAIAESSYYEPPDFTSDFCIALMQIIAKRINKQYAEADREHAAWLEEGSHYEQMVEDRSDDARTAIRPLSASYPTAGMV